MQKYLLMLLIALVGAVGTPACKSKKKAAEAAAAEAAAKKAAADKAAAERREKDVAQAKEDLYAIMENKTMTAAEKEAALAKIKAKNLNDPEVKALIERIEGQVAEQKQLEADKKLAEEERKKIANAPLNVRLTRLFDQIANAPSVGEANNLIGQALGMFSSPNVPVFKIIGVFNGEKDFDKPTDITQYLNYLKDQKKNLYQLQTWKLDATGKISELELMIKK
jgi:membrane-bound lytic murein transglycosylase